jgi:hypothetical protein
MLTISKNEAEALIAASVGPRVTLDHIKSRVAHVNYSRPMGTLTICVLTLLNGFNVTGEGWRSDTSHLVTP